MRSQVAVKKAIGQQILLRLKIDASVVADGKKGEPQEAFYKDLTASLSASSTMARSSCCFLSVVSVRPPVMGAKRASHELFPSGNWYNSKKDESKALAQGS